MNVRWFAGFRRRVASMLLSLATLWTVSVTAGSENIASAAQALREAASLSAVRLELGIRENPDGLSTAAALALRQTPLLYSARDNAQLFPEAEPGDGVSGNAQPSVSDAAPQDSNAAPKNSGDAPQDSNAASATDSGDATTADYGEKANQSPPVSDESDAGNAAPPVAETAPDADPPTKFDTAPDKSAAQEAIPLQEAAQEPIPQPDNGIRARTLIPKSADGYTVCGRVYISSSRKGPLNTEALRETFDAELSGDGPQILILHSHGSEAYTPAPGTELVWWGDSRTTDFRYSVVRVGDEMASVFENAGISTLHDRTLYDYPDYSGSYDRSLSAIESYLAQYPSIRFVLDVHRDYIADSSGNPYKVISEIDGLGTAAQLTLVMGSDGSGLSHPRWMENLKLAVAIQEQILGDYPTLMRPMLLRKSRYNQHATTGSLLVEVGAAGNSPEEALLAGRLFAQEMTEVLQARSK